ncbi:MAG: Uncharacterised protein [SAR116 cluster bacterium]|nr:MAG: Uncharacterised protein [SAR116 cluster bacterium]
MGIKAITEYGAGTAVKKTIVNQFAHDKANAAGGMEMVYIRLAIRIDAGQQRCHL